MIGIIDYGLGNLSSVLNALKKIRCEAIIFNKAEELDKFDKVILPGVGSFKAGMDNLKKKNWIPAINNHVSSGKPLLGICLGMQLLFSQGEEDGENRGLDLISGKVQKMKINKDLKLPHVGWNNLINIKEHKILQGIKKNIDFYFVHSFSCIPDEKECVIAEFNYGNHYVACVSKNNIFGTQFHPEKSLPSGPILLKNFINWNLKC